MGLFQNLPEKEVNQLWEYLCDHAGGSVLPRDQMEYFLRYWSINKEPFYWMFGNQMIIKKDVCFDKPFNDLVEEMEGRLRYDCGEAIRFAVKFRNIIDEKFPYSSTERSALRSFVTNYKMLVNNYYEGPPITIPGSMTTNGRPLQVNTNCKAIKMLGKIAEALGCADDYEGFRQAHSLVLNQKVIRGKLCLSIHPLDFLTMSDNDCGWSSCMSWMDDPGDYRLGTIEMMNSPYVVIAYVEAKEPMKYIGGGEESTWNSKRWRQLYVITPEMILGNRQYPYNHDLLQGTAIKWLRELATPIPGFGPYDEETCQVRNGYNNVFNGCDNQIYVGFTMDYMYNDIYDYRLAYTSSARMKNLKEYRRNLSGPAVCTGCGDIIEYDTVDASQVRCRACSGYFYCSHCGEWCGGDSYEGSDGKLYCDWCYFNELEICDSCEERSAVMRHVYIQLFDEPQDNDDSFCNWSFYVSLCDGCYHNPDSYEKYYGKIYVVEDDYGRSRLAFNLKDVTDLGLEIGSLDPRSIEYLQEIRDASTIEERRAVVKKFSI